MGKGEVPKTTEGKLGYICARVDDISDDVVEIKGDVSDLKTNTVSHEECDRRHEATEVSLVTQSSLIREFDIWDWARKRLPVILALLALLGGMYAVWQKIESSSKGTDELRMEIRKLRGHGMRPSARRPGR